MIFDKNKLPQGKIRELVRIETNDPQHPTTEVYFTMDIQRSAEQEQNRLLLAELTKLRSEVSTLRKDVEAIKKTPAASAGPTAARAEDTKIYDIPIGESPVLGAADAAVTIVEFSDFQCPYCVKEYPKIQQMLADYPGKVRVVFKHYPLAMHKQAPAAHAAAMVAFKQNGSDGFWKMHDMILSDSTKLDAASLKVYAMALGLDTVGLDKVLADDKAIPDLLKADRELAAKCNVRGTPTVFINGKKLADRSVESYRSRVQEILNSKTITAMK